MPSCDACRQRHVACAGDGNNPCPRCISIGKGDSCTYSKKRKAGPRQGWLQELKDQVADLKTQLAQAQAEKGSLLPAGGQSIPSTAIGDKEYALIRDFLQHSNNLVPVVPQQTPEEFIARLSTPPSNAATAAAHYAAKQAVLNAVLALSSLLQLPLGLRRSPAGVANSTAVAVRKNPRQLVFEATAPYFDIAKTALKECFSLPCLDTTSALLALSTCCQICDDATSGFLYSNMAANMCEMSPDIPNDMRASCTFIKTIRSTSTSGGCNLPNANPAAGGLERFLEIVGNIMVGVRTQHCPKQPWPKAAWEEAPVEKKSGGWCPFREAFALLEEAEEIQRRDHLPIAARLWVLALRGRIKSIQGDFEAAAPIFEDVATTAVNVPQTMQDPFSLYACYSIAFSLQHLEVKGGAFAELWKLMQDMASVWPLAETLLCYVTGPGEMSAEKGVYSICKGSASSCVAKVEDASLKGMPPPTCPILLEKQQQQQQQQQLPLSESTAGGYQGTDLLDAELPSKRSRGVDPLGGQLPVSDEVMMGDLDDVFVEEPPAMAAGAHSGPSSSSSNTIPAGTVADFQPVHTKEEYGVPLFTPDEEVLLDEFIQGIFEDQDHASQEQMLDDIMINV